MKKVTVFIVALFAFINFRCHPDSKYGEPVIAPEAVFKKPMNFMMYRQKYLRLAEDFVALDSAENVLDRGTFLKWLSTGRYLPLRLRTKDSIASYQLYPIPDAADTIRQWSEQLYLRYGTEAKELPGLP